jgi:retinol dehydrogenase-12
MSWLPNVLGQAAFIAAPTLTEKNIGDLSGKVCLVTGGNTGIGYELCKILYSANATVWLAGRSVEKCQTAVDKIKAAHPSSRGSIQLLLLDLADLTTIKSSAEKFLSSTQRLDFLCLNAGVMMPPFGSKTAQGHELQMGTNCLGSYLFAELLKNRLVETAKTAPPNSVRIAWAASTAVDVASPKGGITFDPKTDSPKVLGVRADYGQSKAGNLFLSNTFAKETEGSGIVSIAFNPGNLKTELQRHMPSFATSAMGFLLYPPIFGAYTELWCGFSQDLTTADNGLYVAPWGKKSKVRGDVQASIDKTGLADKFRDYCRRETEKYM